MLFARFLYGRKVSNLRIAANTSWKGNVAPAFVLLRLQGKNVGERCGHKKTELWNKILSVPFFNFNGCSGRDRTYDQVINSHLLYR